jgi:transposase-like protein
MRGAEIPRTRPPCPPESRLEAVRLLRSGARSPKQLAAELGCSPQTLTNWLRQDQAELRVIAYWASVDPVGFENSVTGGE